CMLVWGPAEFGLSLCPSSRGSVLGELVRVGLPEVCRVSLWRRCRGAAQSGVVQAALERLRVEAFRLGFGALGKLLPALAPGERLCVVAFLLLFVWLLSLLPPVLAVWAVSPVSVLLLVLCSISYLTPLLAVCFGSSVSVCLSVAASVSV
uniref:Uncharacterized protein n=1 Tax=Coturnix japonica TaxID=93934 RepID=A0A8C2TSK4_COTJA